jgi:hypothetical protein
LLLVAADQGRQQITLAVAKLVAVVVQVDLELASILQ